MSDTVTDPSSDPVNHIYPLPWSDVAPGPAYRPRDEPGRPGGSDGRRRHDHAAQTAEQDVWQGRRRRRQPAEAPAADVLQTGELVSEEVERRCRRGGGRRQEGAEEGSGLKCHIGVYACLLVRVLGCVDGEINLRPRAFAWVLGRVEVGDRFAPMMKVQVGIMDVWRWV